MGDRRQQTGGKEPIRQVPRPVGLQSAELYVAPRRELQPPVTQVSGSKTQYVELRRRQPSTG